MRISHRIKVQAKKEGTIRGYPKWRYKRFVPGPYIEGLMDGERLNEPRDDYYAVSERGRAAYFQGFMDVKNERSQGHHVAFITNLG